MKKLKWINHYESVVNTEEYKSLKEARNTLLDYFNSVLDNKDIQYKAGLWYDNTYVVSAYLGDKFMLIVKVFNSDDADYNKVCAEELAELLNQKH